MANRKPHFARRAARDGNEGLQFRGRGTFETLSDVVGDGERGAIQLIAKAGGERHIWFLEQIDLLVRPSRIRTRKPTGMSALR